MIHISTCLRCEGDMVSWSRVSPSVVWLKTSQRDNVENTTISMTTLTTVSVTRIITSLMAKFPPAVTPGVHVRVSRNVTNLNIVQPMARVTILLPVNIMLPNGRPSEPTTVSTMNTF